MGGPHGTNSKALTRCGDLHAFLQGRGAPLQVSSFCNPPDTSVSMRWRVIRGASRTAPIARHTSFAPVPINISVSENVRQANAMRGSSRSGSRVESARHIEVPGKPVEFCFRNTQGLAVFTLSRDGRWRERCSEPKPRLSTYGNS